MHYHDIETASMTKGRQRIFVNEPWLIDLSNPPQLKADVNKCRDPEQTSDNIRVYIPLDLNHVAILRRLDWVILKYGEATEENESRFAEEIETVISQLEIFDQLRFTSDISKTAKHRPAAVKLAKEIIMRLKTIPDAGAESFPFELIEELQHEFAEK